MTIKEMFSTVRKYNDAARVLNRPELVITAVAPFMDELTATTYKGFTKAINAEFVDPAAAAILDCKSFEFGEAALIGWRDVFGDLNIINLTIYAEPIERG